MKKILVIDDEAGIRTVLRGVLQSAGYQVTTAASGEDAMAHLQQAACDLVLVDLQMPGMDGLELIRQARALHPRLATVILTGFGTVDTAVAALRQGVDDYLLKPAQPQAIRDAIANALAQRQASLDKEQLLSRMVSDIQEYLGAVPPPPRTTGTATPAVFQQGPLALDKTTHQAIWHGVPLALTPTQFKLLCCLATRAGQVLSPQELVTAVQGYQCSPKEARELIKPHLYSLRASLEPDPSHPQYLVNVRGVGYKLCL